MFLTPQRKILFMKNFSVFEVGIKSAMTLDVCAFKSAMLNLRVAVDF